MAILIAVVGLEFLYEKISLFKFGKALKSILLLLFVLPVAVKAGMQIHHRSAIDTRTQAFEWIIENIPPGKNLIVETYGPQLPSGVYNLSMVVNGVPMARGQRGGFVMPSGSLAGLSEYELLADGSIDFVVVTNFYDRYKLNPKEHKIAIQNYENIFDNALLVKEFLPSGGAGIHPFKANVSGGLPIKIYQINKN
jgi:hypothetical protein